MIILYVSEGKYFICNNYFCQISIALIKWAVKK
jgi:hypothetical protein